MDSETVRELSRVRKCIRSCELALIRFDAEALYYEGNEVGSWLELLHWAQGCFEADFHFVLNVSVVDD